MDLEATEKRGKRDLLVEYIDDLVLQRYRGTLEISFKDGHIGMFPHRDNAVNLQNWRRRRNSSKKGYVETVDGKIINDSKNLARLGGTGKTEEEG